MNISILTMILSSSVIAGVITVLFNYMASQKQNYIQNITKERQQWREEIRKIARSLSQEDDTVKIRIILTDLKVRINAYGYADDEIMHDSHLWKIIETIEHGNENEIKEYKGILIICLSNLLKYDWERAKQEVRGNIYLKVLITIQVVCGILLIIGICVTEVNSNEAFSALLTWLFFCGLELIVFYFATQNTRVISLLLLTGAIFACGSALNNVSDIKTIALFPMIPTVYLTFICYLSNQKNNKRYVNVIRNSLHADVKYSRIDFIDRFFQKIVNRK